VGQEVEQQGVHQVRLLLGEEVRGPGDDGELGVRQRVEHRDRVGQGHDVVVGEHDQRPRGDPREVGPVHVRFVARHLADLPGEHPEVLHAVR
jgi:hypothetical protein